VSSLPERIAIALEPWYEAEKRDLPWRGARDPYSIWVSEVMLQQTRVETVKRYYDGFLARFPDVGTLAAADEDAVLGAWSGLGYYRRARMLHQGAQYVVDELGGCLPDSPAALREIPGVGPYTAGAIAAIAFDRCAPLVDGNVARVLSRVCAQEDPREQGADADRNWATVRAILGHGRPRMLAQALMELGATVCTVRSPQCEACPLHEHCEARARGLVDRIPQPRRRVAKSTERFCALAVCARRRVLLVRRPPDGLLANVWCLPLVSVPRRGRQPRTPPHAQAEELLGVPVEFESEPLEPLRHVFTHRIWDLHPWACRAERTLQLPNSSPKNRRWIRRGERPEGGIPAVTDKLLARVGW
jgi:A/G-specific adenine glycosylase